MQPKAGAQTSWTSGERMKAAMRRNASRGPPTRSAQASPRREVGDERTRGARRAPRPWPLAPHALGDEERREARVAVGGDAARRLEERCRERELAQVEDQLAVAGMRVERADQPVVSPRDEPAVQVAERARRSRGAPRDGPPSGGTGALPPGSARAGSAGRPAQRLQLRDERRREAVGPGEASRGRARAGRRPPAAMSRSGSSSTSSSSNRVLSPVQCTGRSTSSGSPVARHGASSRRPRRHGPQAPLRALGAERRATGRPPPGRLPEPRRGTVARAQGRACCARL